MTVAEQLRALRIAGEFAQAREVIRSQAGFASSPSLQRLLHDQADFWWQPIAGRSVTLQRRDAEDAAFVRACWADADFMRKFNRAARPLPVGDEELRGILARERAGLLTEARALHWTLVARSGEPVGFVSVTDFVPGHRRAEFLIGVLHRPPSALPVEAARLAITFLRERAGVERLTAYFYPDNLHAIKVAEKFGFVREGVLRGYIREAATGARVDMVVAGMLLDG